MSACPAPSLAAGTFGRRSLSACRKMNVSSSRGPPRTPSARRQNHDDLTALEARLLFDLRDLGRVALDAVEQLIAQLLVRHFTAAEAQRHLDLVAFLEEPLNRAHLH